MVFLKWNYKNIGFFSIDYTLITDDYGNYGITGIMGKKLNIPDQPRFFCFDIINYHLYSNHIPFGPEQQQFTPCHAPSFLKFGGQQSEKDGGILRWIPARKYLQTDTILASLQSSPKAILWNVSADVGTTSGKDGMPALSATRSWKSSTSFNPNRGG